MQRHRLKASAAKIIRLREEARTAEKHLLAHLHSVLTVESTKKIALEIGISPQYLCDIRYARRGLTDAVLLRITGSL